MNFRRQLEPSAANELLEQTKVRSATLNWTAGGGCESLGTRNYFRLLQSLFCFASNYPKRRPSSCLSLFSCPSSCFPGEARSPVEPEKP